MGSLGGGIYHLASSLRRMGIGERERERVDGCMIDCREMMGYIIMSSCIIQYHIISYISHHIVKNMLAVYLLTYLLTYTIPSSEFRVPSSKAQRERKGKGENNHKRAGGRN